jgi:hypothetical protein
MTRNALKELDSDLEDRDISLTPSGLDFKFFYPVESHRNSQLRPLDSIVVS